MRANDKCLSCDDKLIRLSTLAQQTGISVHCIRTYIDCGLIQVSVRTAGGMFLFYEPVIERLRFIRMARNVDGGVAEFGKNSTLRLSDDT